MQKFSYKLMEDGNYCVMGYFGDEAEIVIPETYQDGTVTVLYDQLFAGHPEITSVKIPDTVTDMGEHVFDGCQNLKTLTLPSKLTSLWGYTFVRSGLEEITLPESLAIIPPFAFKDCKNLRKVVCGTGLKRIHAWAFGGCDKLEQVLYGPGVKVSPEAFQDKELNT